MEILRAEGLTKVLPGETPVTLVNNVSLSVSEGDFLAVTGPSGSGKSSLLYLLGLLDRPSSGKIFLRGEDVSTYDEDRLATIRLEQLGFVFQFHFLLPEFSALENVLLPIQRRGALTPSEGRDRAMFLLEKLGIAEHANKIPRKLSGGQSQRVAIARALANSPRVVLADEPTGNLDSTSSAQVNDLLASLVKEFRTAVIVVTHDREFAAGAARSITLIDGEIRR